MAAEATYWFWFWLFDETPQRANNGCYTESCCVGPVAFLAELWINTVGVPIRGNIGQIHTALFDVVCLLEKLICFQCWGGGGRKQRENLSGRYISDVLTDAVWRSRLIDIAVKWCHLFEQLELNGELEGYDHPDLTPPATPFILVCGLSPVLTPPATPFILVCGLSPVLTLPATPFVLVCGLSICHFLNFGLWIVLSFNARWLYI